jgi:glycosyltransferase involved in cell wall biosynthesis
MASVWRAAHIGLHPSRREGLPKSLLEAAACGLALVATDVPGCREVVIDGDNGFLVPPRDPVGLAGALECLERDPDLRARMGRRSRELVEEHFAESIVVRETLALYRDIVRAEGS